MVTVQPIHSGLFSNLYRSFLSEDDPLSDEQDWRNVFDYPWETEEGHCGYALLNAGDVVGMLGMVFSQREIAGTRRKFCNLHTWWVREDFRGRSLSLLRPILGLDEYTITHFTPCDTIRAVTKRMGFKELSSQLKILLPVRSRDRHGDLSLIFDERSIERELNDRDKQILRDHLPYGCGHLLVSDGSRSTYLLYTHVVRHRLPYCHIHYISDQELFAEVEPAIRSALLKRHCAWFVAVDTRLAEGIPMRRTFDFWAPAHAVYRSPDLGPQQIDHLYSDVVFLKLTVLPDISHELGQLARSWWSRS